jgi:hypothetical protein
MNVLVQSFAATALTAALSVGGFSLDGDALKGKLPQNESNLQVVELIEFNDVELNCVDAFKLDDQLVINSQTELNKWYELVSNGAEDCALPMVDFTKESLVILKLNVGGCDVPTVLKTVLLHENKKALRIKLDIKQNGLCKMLHVVPVFFTIPKIADDFNVYLNKTKTYK